MIRCGIKIKFRIIKIVSVEFDQKRLFIEICCILFSAQTIRRHWGSCCLGSFNIMPNNLGMLKIFIPLMSVLIINVEVLIINVELLICVSCIM